MKHITILGAGPSGMMAAHAASQFGHEVIIFDKDPDQTRKNSGIYYLHHDCDLALDRVEIRQVLIGGHGKTAEEIALAYGNKVYGKPVLKNSAASIKGNPSILGFNSKQAIQRLWDLYGSCVKKNTIESFNDVKYLCTFQENSLVICTIPAPFLFPDLRFESEKIWLKVGKAPPDEAFVFYNINPNQPWYRCSAIFGIFTKEYSHSYQPESKDGYSYREVTKVISGSELPKIENLFYTGRYGAWDKTYLTDTVYYKTLEWLSKHG